jgi:hypothetical protein
MGVNWAILIRDDTKSRPVVVSVKYLIVDLFLLLDLISLFTHPGREQPRDPDILSENGANASRAIAGT